MANFEVMYDEEFTMKFIEKIEKNYITQFIPEYFEMKYIRHLKLPLLPIQNECNENNAAIKIQNWFRSDIVKNNLKSKKLLKLQKQSIVRKSNAIML